MESPPLILCIRIHITNTSKKFNYEVRSDVAKLAPAIIDVMEVAQTNGVRCWLNYGALLGMIREQRLLPWNNDAQLCCWYETNLSYKFKRITEELNKMGYHAIYYSTIGAISIRQKGVAVHITCYWQDGDYAVRPHESPSDFGYAPFTARIFYWLATFMGAYPSGLAGKNDVPLSINEFIKIVLVSGFRILPVFIRKKLFIFLINSSKLFGGVFQKTAIPVEYFEKLMLCDFYGGKVYVPGKSEQLLCLIYGKEWNVPKDAWSFYDEKNKGDSGIIFIDETWDYATMDII